MGEAEASVAGFEGGSARSSVFFDEVIPKQCLIKIKHCESLYRECMPVVYLQNMDLHIKTIQELKILASSRVFTQFNISKISKIFEYLDLVGKLPTQAAISRQELSTDMKITWIPKYSKPCCIFLDAETGINIFLIDGDHVQSFWATDTYVPENKVISNVALFGNITCDVISQDETQMVLLISDCLRGIDFDDHEEYEKRYAFLVKHREFIECIRIGNLILRIQWCGNTETFDTLKTLSLPHSMGGIIAFEKDKIAYKFVSEE